MVETTPAVRLEDLTPLPYQQALAAHLQAHEPEVWRWAASAEAREEHAAAVRAALLRNSYRLDATAHPELHAHASLAAQRMGVTARITLYQAGDGAMNAAIHFIPGEAHIVLSGPLLERLQGPELQAVLGHELAHYLLWERDGGKYHVVDRVLNATAADPRADASHLQAAQRYALYTEAFADRGGCVACGALEPAVSALVKVQTGLSQVNAASYLRQADEICAEPGTQTRGTSHPEVFVRARALRLWTGREPDADDWLASALEGPLDLGTLDILGQQRVGAITRGTIAQLLQRPFLQSEPLLAHARRFFPDFKPPTAAMPPAEPVPAGLHDYLASVLVDFVAADPELDDVTLAAALGLADALGCAEPLEARVVKDMRFPKRSLTRVKRDAAALLDKALTQHQQQAAAA
ncbi:SprT-like domain-containing protein [Variovorax sp. E3]|uniref:SprT-like domain-containing protein n=1 Tax=Variovorax sp. E3 TaxID=1914993 RepID=UPI0018DC1711|nr:SprT-like domain-containing protein [Variovorax sp. E3]